MNAVWTPDIALCSGCNPRPLGTTWGRPELAVGSAEGEPIVLVVWTADEVSTTSEMETRWALRELAGGAWTIFDGFRLRASRVGAAFEAGTNQWLIVTLSNEADMNVSVLDLDGTLLEQEVPLGAFAYDFASPTCDHGQPGCTMVFSASNRGGPSLGRADFSVSAGPADVVLDGLSLFAGNEEVFGALDFSRAELGALRGVAGQHRVEVDLDLDGGIDPQDPPTSSLRDWPLTIGAIAGEHRLGMALPVRCGDGLVQADEECDDGNRTPGDGCDDQCMAEFGGTGTGTGTGTGGEDLLGPNDGCQCGLEDDGPSNSWGAALLWLGLSFGATRRRRRGQ